MRIIFSANGVDTEFTRKQIVFAEAPEFTTSFQVYEEIINIPSLSLRFVYDDRFASSFIDYLRANLNEIESIKIYRDNGVLIFSGLIDEKSEIEIDDYKVKLDFIHEVSAMLEETLPDNASIASGLYDAPEYTPGELVFEDLISEFVASWMPGYTATFPTDWVTTQPYYWIAINKLDTFSFSTLAGYKVEADLGGRSKLDCLKLFCMATKSRVLVESDTLIFVSYAKMPVPKIPDGTIRKKGESISKSNQIGVTTDGTLRILAHLKRTESGEFFYYKPSSENVMQWLDEYYESNGVLSYSECAFVGLNTNLNAGDSISWGGVNLLITSMSRSGDLIDESLQSVSFDAIEVKDV